MNYNKLVTSLFILLELSFISSCNQGIEMTDSGGKTSDSIGEISFNESSSETSQVNSEISSSISISDPPSISSDNISSEKISSELISYSEDFSTEISNEPSSNLSEEISSSDSQINMWENGNDNFIENLFSKEIAIAKVYENKSFSLSMINKNRTMNKEQINTFKEIFKDCKMETLLIYDLSTNEYTDLYKQTQEIKDECLYVEIVFYDYIDCGVYIDHNGYVFAYKDSDDVWYRSTSPIDKGEVKKYLIRIGNKTASLSEDSGKRINNTLLDSLKNNNISNIIVCKNYDKYLYGLPSESFYIEDKKLLNNILEDLCLSDLTLACLNTKDEEGIYTNDYITHLSNSKDDTYFDVVFKNNDYGYFYIDNKGYLYTFEDDNTWYKSEETVSLTSLLYNVGLVEKEPEFGCAYNEVFDYLKNESIHSITIAANEDYFWMGSPSDKIRTRKEQNINLIVGFFKEIEFAVFNATDNQEKYDTAFLRRDSDIYIDILFNNYKFSSLYIEKDSGYVYCIDNKEKVLYYSTSPINIDLFIEKIPIPNL